MLQYAVAQTNSSCSLLHASTQPQHAQRKHRAACTAQRQSMLQIGLLLLRSLLVLLDLYHSAACAAARSLLQRDAHRACTPTGTYNQVFLHVQLRWLMRAPLQPVKRRGQACDLPLELYGCLFSSYPAPFPVAIGQSCY